MINERLTEEIVRSHFKSDPLAHVIRLEEQKSRIKRVNDCLKTSSKSGTSNVGCPEFIISFPSQNTNNLIIVECKFHLHKHESKNRTNIKEFAVDGVLHYCRFLSKDYNVIAIAVSGESANEIKVSTFKWIAGADAPVEIESKELLSINSYLKIFDDNVFSENLKNIDILQKAVHLNEEFHSYSITENGRCTNSKRYSFGAIR